MKDSIASTTVTGVIRGYHNGFLKISSRLSRDPIIPPWYIATKNVDNLLEQFYAPPKHFLQL